MWGSPRLLNMAAGFLVGLAVLAFAFMAFAWLWRSASFPVNGIDVRTPLAQTTKEEIETAARSRITGNFFAVSPAEVRAGLERLPWVRRASVRRVWPDRLEVGIEEHVALARWGGETETSALINTHGERFIAVSNESLPQFLAPAGAEPEVARRYPRFSAALAPLGVPLERVILTARFAWQLRLGNGLTLMLGRDAELAEQRLRRFVEVYPQTLGQIAKRHEYVDLRYPNGFALRLPSLPPPASG